MPEESKKLLRSGAVVSGATMGSRLLGFVRDQIWAVAFGPSGAMDAFLLAFALPNFLRRLFAEGAFSQAFVPVFSAYREQLSHDKLRLLCARVSGTLGAVVLAVTLLVMLGAPYVLAVVAPGLDGLRAQWAGDFLRITFPYLFCISLVAYAGGVLNASGRYAIPALTPILLNLCLISAALLAPRWFAVPEYGLAWGVALAGVVQLLFQLPFLGRLGLLVWPRWAWRDPQVQRVIMLMLPGLFAASVAQINLLFDKFIASLLAEGSFGWLYFADRLMELPLGVIGVGIATVVLPPLSRAYANDDPQRSAATLAWALRMVLVLGIPAALGLALLAEGIVSTLFGYGAFGSDDVQRTVWALTAYSLGVPAFMLIKILSAAFFARQDTRTPVRIAVRAMVANMALNVVLVGAVSRWQWEAAHVGLALATSASAWLQVWWLSRALRRQNIASWEGVSRVFWRSVVLGGVLLLAWLSWWWGDHWLGHWSTRAAQLALCLGGGMLAYGLGLLGGGLRWSTLRE